MNWKIKIPTKTLRARTKSFKYAFQGLYDLLLTQPNARIHGVASLVAIFMGLFFQISSSEWYAVIVAIGMVWTAEAFNTALEYLTDLVSPEYHPLAGKVKDVAAAGVLLAAITALTLGVLVFGSKLMAYWG
ncbi:MAG TPA: diacylglycerol kinase family protein [Saprospiraceae bacterium]|nr:diacylglycerol kinase family protein [Saprospiraceae bacterium]HMQ82090.1 diacylglycerol kinase family protein [Saprospiraceae bacterium]